MVAEVAKDTRFRIVGGPSDMGLLLALFSRERPEPVIFEFSSFAPGIKRGVIGIWIHGLSNPHSEGEETVRHWYQLATGSEQDPWDAASILMDKGQNNPHSWEFDGRLAHNSPINPGARVRGLFDDHTHKGILEVL